MGSLVEAGDGGMEAAVLHVGLPQLDLSGPWMDLSGPPEMMSLPETVFRFQRGPLASGKLKLGFEVPKGSKNPPNLVLTST